jgi:predicted DNA-binding protein (MmcQ/YjbR family)
VKPRPRPRTQPGSRRAARRPARTPVDRLRAICLALPETTEKVAWGEPTWRVRGRLFAQLDDHHHGAEHLAVWLPAPLGEQEAMIFADPARFFRPPYVGHRGWVGVRIDGRPDWSLVAKLVERAYRHVAPPPRRRARPA